MLRASRKATEMLECGEAHLLLDLPLPVPVVAFDSAAMRGDLDAFVVLCQIRAQALGRIIDGQGNSIHDFEHVELPYRLFGAAAEHGHMKLLQWMLDHYAAIALCVRGVGAFGRAARST